MRSHAMNVAGIILEDHAGHAAVPGPLQTRDSDAIDDVGAGGGGGIDQQSIQHVPPRRIQRIDPVARGDRHRHRLIAIEERRLPDGRRAGRYNGRQDAPSMQLNDRAAHERVR